MPKVVEGLRLHTFHWLVPPMPISYTEERMYYDEWQQMTKLSEYKFWESESEVQYLRQGLTFSETQEPLEWRETHGPMAPQTFSSLDVYKQRKRRDINSSLTTAFILFPSNDTYYDSKDSKTPKYIYLDFHDASEGHAEVSVVVFIKDPLEGLLEQGGVEGVSHHNVTPDSTVQQIVKMLNYS